MKINKVKEICLYVKDLDVTRSFYEGKLNLPVISKVEGKHIFFRSGSNVLLCFIPEDSREKTIPPGHYAYGKQHIAFEVDKDQYEDWKEFIKSKGIPITHEEPWKGGTLHSFYFEDPDGHILEIVPEGMWD